MNIGLIIFTAFNIASAIVNIITLKHFVEIEKHIEKKSLPTIVPVAEVKTQFSEEYMKKIRELLKGAKPTVVTEEPEIDKPNETDCVPNNDEVADEKKCECGHFYDSVYIDQDVKHCCERLIFHCRYCNHEEIIPVERGLITKLILNGGCARF